MQSALKVIKTDGQKDLTSRKCSKNSCNLSGVTPEKGVFLVLVLFISI